MKHLVDYFYNVTGLGIHLFDASGNDVAIGPNTALNALMPSWEEHCLKALEVVDAIEVLQLQSGLHTILFKIKDHKGFVYPFYIGDLSIEAIERLKIINGINGKDAYYQFRKLQTLSNTRLNYILNFIENTFTHAQVLTPDSNVFAPETTSFKPVNVDLEHPPNHDYVNEKKLMTYITEGKTSGLRHAFIPFEPSKLYSFRDSSLRSLKNNAIVYITLAVRAGIDGGLSVKKALTLADIYIIRVEKAITFEDLITIDYKFTEELCAMVKASKSDDYIIRLVKTYIEDHLDEKISRDQVAKHVNLSSSYLSKYIKEKSGYTLTDLIHLERLNHAKKLLKYSNLDLLTIALSCGYDTQNYFTTCFKKLFNESPGHYRRKTLMPFFQDPK